jgi:hypothetical protein
MSQLSLPATPDTRDYLDYFARVLVEGQPGTDEYCIAWRGLVLGAAVCYQEVEGFRRMSKRVNRLLKQAATQSGEPVPEKVHLKPADWEEYLRNDLSDSLYGTIDPLTILWGLATMQKIRPQYEVPAGPG